MACFWSPDTFYYKICLKHHLKWTTCSDLGFHFPTTWGKCKFGVGKLSIMHHFPFNGGKFGRQTSSKRKLIFISSFPAQCGKPPLASLPNTSTCVIWQVLISLHSSIWWQSFDWQVPRKVNQPTDYLVKHPLTSYIKNMFPTI